MGIEELLLDIHPLSRLFVAAFVMVGVPSLIYMWSLHRDAWLAVLSIGFIAAALGVVLSPNFLWFLVFWELMMLLACWLIMYERTPSSFAVAYRYFLAQVIAGASLFFAIAVQYAATGSFEMGAVVPQAVPFFLAAFTIKAAVIPLHIWVPLTYPSVPPAVAVILSAYATKVGVYAFARLLPGIPWIAYAGACMALIGVVMALRQRTARRLLSYHLISQVGYMITAIGVGTVGVGTDLGIRGGTLHMMNHVAYKSLLFMVVGAVVYRTGTDVLARVGGVGKSMPLTFLAGLTGAAAISGVPPFNGYVSKTLLKAAIEGHVFLQWALFLASIGTALSFTKFIWYLFLNKHSSDAPANRDVTEMPLAACLSMGMLAMLCLAQGIAYRRFYAVAWNPDPGDVYLLKSILLGVVPVLAGIALYAVSRRIGRFAMPADRRGVEFGKASASASVTVAAPLREELLPWDIDVVYSWLLGRLLGVNHSIALRAKDETQGYILVITVFLIGLVVFLSW